MKLTREERKNRSRFLLLPAIAVLIAIVFLLMCYWFPLLAANDAWRKYLFFRPNEPVASNVHLTNEKLMDISLVELFALYWEKDAINDTVVAIFVFAIFGGVASIALISLLFALLKKPIAVIVLNFLSMGIFFLLMAVIKKEINFDNYMWSYGRLLFFAGFVLVFLTSLWLLNKKRDFESKVVIRRMVQRENSKG